MAHITHEMPLICIMLKLCFRDLLAMFVVAFPDVARSLKIGRLLKNLPNARKQREGGRINKPPLYP